MRSTGELAMNTKFTLTNHLPEMVVKRLALLAFGLAAIVVTMISAMFSAPAQADDVLLSEADIRISSVEEGAESGFSVSGAGDVNGDGLADFIIGAPLADSPPLDGQARVNNVLSLSNSLQGIPVPRPDAGRAFVVFGQTDHPVVLLEELDQGGGFIINGQQANAHAGDSVSGVGDVNGDGYDDLLVGAIGQEAAYLVYGKPDSTTVDLIDINSGDFLKFQLDDEGFSGDWDSQGDDVQINGQSNFIGDSVSGIGDFDGDGVPDLILGGTAVIIVLGGDGTRIEVEPGGEVSGVGDVNGDGRDDVIVGGGVFGSSVIYGGTSTDPIDRDNLGPRGFQIEGDGFSNALGDAVAGAGDVNGDGFADVILGDPGSEPFAPGSAYVIFGAALNDDISVDALGARGFQIGGADENKKGTAVSAAGDVDGDGLSDLLLGAPRGSGKNVDTGAYGLPGQTDANNRIIPDDATFYQPVSILDRAGQGLSGVGDSNGDGVPDLVIGAHRADPVENVRTGETYVVFSDTSLPPSASYRLRVRNGATPLRPAGSNGDGSNVSHPNAHAWIGFSDGSAPGISDFASEVTVQLFRDDIFAPNSATPHAWFISTERENWTEAQLKFRYFQNELPGGYDERRLRLFFSPTEVGPAGPFTQVDTEFDHDRNLITASVDQLGFFFIGQIGEDAMFADRFEEQE